MKTDIHPQYFDNAQVICACGNTFTTGSTKQTIRVEICSLCHPFFTGQQKLVDTVGSVERFEKQKKVAAQKQSEQKAKKVKAEKDENRPRTLKDMIAAIREQSTQNS